MKNSTTLVATALLAPVLLAFLPTADKVAFTAEEGLSVTRVFETKTAMTLDDMEMTMNGQPFPMEIEMDMNMNMSSTIAVTDEYGASAEGRPSRLTRSFDELTQLTEISVENDMMPDGGMDNSIDAESQLEGKTVVFTWNADEEAFEKAYDGEGEEDLLEGLEEDMDLRRLLPSEDVSEGDTWEIDVKVLRSVMSPGGNLALLPDDDAMGGMEGMPGMDNMSNLNSMFEDLIEGEASGEYKGTREVDGVRCGVIQVKVDVSASADMSDQVADAMEGLPDEMGEMSIDNMDMEVQVEGEGTLLWDLAAGVPHSFELNGEMSMTLDMGFSISMGEQDMSMEQMLDMSGSFTTTLKVTKN